MQAVKLTHRKDLSGLTRATWEYRGVTIDHIHSTNRVRAQWRYGVRTSRGFRYHWSRNEAELLASIDRYLDVLGRTVDHGRVICN